jgi:hypothetical protein
MPPGFAVEFPGWPLLIIPETRISIIRLRILNPEE